MGRGGGKIKNKVVKQTIGNKDILGVFQDLTGGDGVQTRVPKFMNVRHQTGRFIKLIEILFGSSALAHFPEEIALLKEYHSKLVDSLEQEFAAPDLSGYFGEDGRPTSAVPDDVSAAFLDAYEVAMKSYAANAGLITCKNLVPNKAQLGDANHLSDRFMTKSSAMEFAPFEDLQLNYKALYIDMRLEEKDRKFLLTFLHKTYEVTHDLYEALSAPDQDIEEFIEVVMSSLGQMEHHPELHRCKQAFQKIRDSVDLLRDNFGGYHKDYMASGNASIMLENFVLDVKEQHAGDAKVAKQFMDIVKFYRKESQNKKQDPKLRALFSAVDSNFQELERSERAADAATDKSSDDLVDDSAEDESDDE